MNTRVLLVVAMVLVAVLEEATAIPLCNIDSYDLEKCRAAVSGNPPPPPSNDCCEVIRRADRQCLCRFKSYLPTLGIDPTAAIALGAKCGISEVPPACKA